MFIWMYKGKNVGVSAYWYMCIYVYMLGGREGSWDR